MAQSKVTLNEIMLAVREVTFDRFIIPAFAIKQMGDNFYVDIDKTFVPETEDSEEVIKGKITIYKETHSSDTETTEPIVENIVALAFNDYPTLEDLMNAFIENNIVVAYTPYFRGQESSTILIPVKHKELTDDFTAFRRYFFSDYEIKDCIEYYYDRVLDIKGKEINDELVGRLIRPSEKHLVLWVAYHLVDKRRLYECAAGSIGQSFTDGSDYSGSDISSSMGTTTTTQIGSVFTITEDPTKGYFYEDFNRVGSDNVLGDRYSFWYKLMLYIRDLLEQQFGDFSLRKDNVIPGNIELTRDLDFRSYYDSWPFTLSPLSRGLLSKTT